jgi:hypothetical protein
MKDIDALLRRYDAAPNTPLTPAESARADELLTRISNTPRTETIVRKLVRRPLMLSLAGVAAAASVAGAVVTTQSSSHSTSHTNAASGASAPLSIKSITKAELDSWMAAPADPSAIGKAASACLKGAKGAADPQVYAVDQRGSVFTLLAKDPVSQQIWWCLGTPDGTLTSQFVTGPGWPAPTKSAAAGMVNILQLAEEGPVGGRNGYNLGQAYGQAGPGVTSITLTTQTDGKFTAPVQDGYWNVWWPEPASLPDDVVQDTVTWTTANGTSHTAGMASIYQGGVPIADAGLLFPPSGPGKPYAHQPSVNPYTRPNQQATTIVKACGPNTAATISNVVQVGRSFELACTYPESGDQWVVVYNSAVPANAGLQDDAFPVSELGSNGLPLLPPAIAKNAVNWEGGLAGGPTSTTNLLGSDFGRVGADVTSVTLVTQAGKKIPAKVQNGLWTALWPIKSENEGLGWTLTWTTTNGTSYTALCNKVSNNNGLKVPAGTVTTGPTAK